MDFYYADPLFKTKHDMSCVMRKPDFFLCENKSSDQLQVTMKLISAFVFATQYNSSFTSTQNFTCLTFFCGCTGWFVSDLVGNPEGRYKKTRFSPMRKMQRCRSVTAKLNSASLFSLHDSKIPLLLQTQNFKLLTIFFGCTGWFVSDLVLSPKDQFSHIEAHMAKEHN